MFEERLIVYIAVSLLADPKIGEFVMKDLKEVTLRHLRAVQALGAGLKLYFAEKGAADWVRSRFADNEDLAKVAVGFLPPSKPKSRGRTR